MTKLFLNLCVMQLLASINFCGLEMEDYQLFIIAQCLNVLHSVMEG